MDLHILNGNDLQTAALPRNMQGHPEWCLQDHNLLQATALLHAVELVPWKPIDTPTVSHTPEQLDPTTTYTDVTQWGYCLRKHVSEGRFTVVDLRGEKWQSGRVSRKVCVAINPGIFIQGYPTL